VAVNLGNSQENFVEGHLDIFSGADLGECYNFDVGTVATADQFGKLTALREAGSYRFQELNFVKLNLT
jgi:hypothetical protein